MSKLGATAWRRMRDAFESYHLAETRLWKVTDIII